MAYNGLQPGDHLHFGIRPEEIMLIRPGIKLRDPVKANLLSGHVDSIMEKGGSHLIMISIPQVNTTLEIDIPNFAYRDLKLFEGKTVQVSLKMKSIWTIPVKSAEACGER